MLISRSQTIIFTHSQITSSGTGTFRLLTLRPSTQALVSAGVERFRTCLPTPTPTPRDFDSLQRSFSHCVEAGELYQTFKNGVNHADSSLIRLELSAPPDAPLPKPEVVDCNRDGSPDILIPSSLSDGSPAILRVLENACESQVPQVWVLELKAQGEVALTGYDDSGNQVDTKQIDASENTQRIVLNSKTGIRKVEILGEEVCLHRICLNCEIQAEDPAQQPGFSQIQPTPLPSRVIDSSRISPDQTSSTAEMSENMSDSTAQFSSNQPLQLDDSPIERLVISQGYGGETW